MNPDPVASKPSPKLASTLALRRYDAVRWIEEAVKSGLALATALAAAAARRWGDQTYGLSTLERWYYAYRVGGFAALEPQPRLDKGQSRALSPAAAAALVALRRQHPQVHVATLRRQLEAQVVIEPGSVSLTTLYRYLKTHGLDPRTLKASGGATLSGPTKPFEFAHANQLWMADGMHGPRLARPGAPPLRTFLLAVLDDCSRLCPHGQYYSAERLEHFLDTLRHAVQSRGVPEKLYTDNGGLFTSLHLQTICARLGIQLIHHQPYQAWSKGKIERFFQTVQTDFQQRLVFAPVGSLDELNRRFWQWLEGEYHRRPHRGLEDATPAARFAERSQGLRLLHDDLDVAGLFLARTVRRVRRDATIALEGRIFEVPVALRGRLIEVHYDPFGWRRVEVCLDGNNLGPARPCDKQLNSRTFERDNYEKSE
jgi:putative transposase